ncbi:unnamed protein product, partial [Urochloa humidicola]
RFRDAPAASGRDTARHLSTVDLSAARTGHRRGTGAQLTAKACLAGRVTAEAKTRWEDGGGCGRTKPSVPCADRGIGSRCGLRRPEGDPNPTINSAPRIGAQPASSTPSIAFSSGVPSFTPTSKGGEERRRSLPDRRLLVGSQDADLCEDPDREDYHPRGGVI